MLHKLDVPKLTNKIRSQQFYSQFLSSSCCCVSVSPVLGLLSTFTPELKSKTNEIRTKRPDSKTIAGSVHDFSFIISTLSHLNSKKFVTAAQTNKLLSTFCVFVSSSCFQAELVVWAFLPPGLNPCTDVDAAYHALPLGLCREREQKVKEIESKRTRREGKKERERSREEGLPCSPLLCWKALSRLLHLGMLFPVLRGWEVLPRSCFLLPTRVY